MSPQGQTHRLFSLVEPLEHRVFLSLTPAEVLAFKTVHSQVGGSNSGMIATGDFNLDNKADLVGAPLGSSYGQVHFGDGSGRFSPPAIAVVLTIGPNATAVATGEFTGNARFEAIFANDASSTNGTVTLLKGPTLGTGQSFWVGADPTALATLDFNKDGKLDVLVAHGSPWTPQFAAHPPVHGAGVLLGNGDGTFQAEIQIRLNGPQTHVAVGDVNRDGRLDAVFGGPAPTLGPTPAAMLHTVLSGPTGYTTTQFVPFNGDLDELAVGDLNRDGRADLVAVQDPVGQVMETGSPAFTLLSNGDGEYSMVHSIPTYIGHGTGIGLADFDRDGALDVAVSGPHTLIELAIYPIGGVSFLRGGGTGALLPAQVVRRIQIPGTMTVINADKDQRPDVATGNNLGITALVNVTRIRIFKTNVSTAMPSIADDVLLNLS